MVEALIFVLGGEAVALLLYIFWPSIAHGQSGLFGWVLTLALAVLLAAAVVAGFALLAAIPLVMLSDWDYRRKALRSWHNRSEASPDE